MAKKSLEELYNEYGQLAAQHGDLDYQISRMEFRKKQLRRSMQYVQGDIGKLQPLPPGAALPKPKLTPEEQQEQLAKLNVEESSND